MASAETGILASLQAANPHAHFFTVGDGAAEMIACVEADHCLVLYIGDCTPDQKVALFAQIKAQHGAAAVRSLLIDFSRFTGVVDWNYVKHQKNTAPGLEPPPAKVAYVVVSEIAGLFAKAILSYSEQHWQVFTNFDEAVGWLGWT